MPQVYIVSNSRNGKLYVGFTVHTFRERWPQHLRSAKSGHSMYFLRAIRKHGPSSFELVAQIDFVTADEGKNAEKVLIALLNTQDGNVGYNVTAGGDGCSCPRPEVREKIRLASIGRFPSEEVRLKISLAGKGNQRWLGRKHSPETLEKMRVVKLGNQHAAGKKYKLSDEQRERKRLSMMGNVHNLGKKDPPEVRKKKSDATKAWRAERKLAAQGAYV